jgi:Na+/H+ antiporter NhaC
MGADKATLLVGESSMAAATDHIDHVRTQLPYALIGGTVAVGCFAILGAVM